VDVNLHPFLVSAIEEGKQPIPCFGCFIWSPTQPIVQCIFPLHQYSLYKRLSGSRGKCGYGGEEKNCLSGE
jgi:hypothetical protein